MLLRVGIDDVDSPLGGCTTYVAAVLASMLDGYRQIEFVDYPMLVRLNPNVPFKTRGNGAVCLRLNVSPETLPEVKSLVVDTVRRLSALKHGKTDPAVVFAVEPVPELLKQLYFKALSSVVALSYAFRVAKEAGVEVKTFKRGRGLIGALAAVGAVFEDFTYELLAYRRAEYWGRRRLIDSESVIRFDRLFRPRVFGNVDYSTGRILIAPHGPDPVLYGVRGDDVEALKAALRIIMVGEPIDRWVIFKTNQGTDSHLMVRKSIGELRPYDSVVVQGFVEGDVEVLHGGDVRFRIFDDTGILDCLVYRETGALNRVVRLLREGDLVEVAGGLRPPSRRHGLTLNVERLRLIRLVPEKEVANPLCPRCGKRMKSMGRGKGFKCTRCGYRDPYAAKVRRFKARLVEPGIYLASARAHRHLTRPLTRYGVRAKPSGRLEKPWHWP